MKIKLDLKFYYYPSLELDQDIGQPISGPVYRMGYLLPIYWSADIMADISNGLSTVDKILA